MNKEIAKEKAKVFFEHSKDLKEIYVADDGQCFLKSHDASKHNKKIKAKSMPVRITPEDYMEVKKPKPTPKKK